ncbi:peroxide stress protein YaaA [Lacticaseibacillus nasuensis]|uniref:peroxide stress protein YaaA n=1 Tax=Lacticaseibacillus nasuensis TaxID=944671 RepID=UPI002245EB46|nr:peroxide stress protein YaaA [Lacticaseibacillus nasuensis]MCX2456089.1 peroxide stress protein YaaA [Lacticaseibacillus nasuensis]
MQFIIAPAKKMRVASADFAPTAWPQYLEAATQLIAAMRRLTYPAAKQLWQCSDRLAQTNYAWLHELDLRQNVSPAVMSYVGIQYQSMAPDLLTEAGLQYLSAHLRILSGLYGVLRPFDAVVPYRLELGSRLAVGEARNLYAFWGQRLYAALDFSAPVINLASAEYAKAIRPYLTADDAFITVTFAHRQAGQLKTRATYAKMARGAMVRFAALHNATTVADLTQFDDPNYAYDAAASTASELVFIRREVQ